MLWNLKRRGRSGADDILSRALHRIVFSMLRKTIWTLPARRCDPCNLHVGTCRQCLEFFPSLRTRCCNTFRRLHCRNRRGVRIYYYQPLSLLFVEPKQRLDVPRVGKGGILGESGEMLNGRVVSVWGCKRRETGQAAPPEAVYTSSTANRRGEREG